MSPGLDGRKLEPFFTSYQTEVGAQKRETVGFEPPSFSFEHHKKESVYPPLPAAPWAAASVGLRLEHRLKLHSSNMSQSRRTTRIVRFCSLPLLHVLSPTSPAGPLRRAPGRAGRRNALEFTYEARPVGKRASDLPHTHTAKGRGARTTGTGAQPGWRHDRGDGAKGGEWCGEGGKRGGRGSKKKTGGGRKRVYGRRGTRSHVFVGENRRASARTRVAWQKKGSSLLIARTRQTAPHAHVNTTTHYASPAKIVRQHNFSLTTTRPLFLILNAPSWNSAGGDGSRHDTAKGRLARADKRGAVEFASDKRPHAPIFKMHEFSFRRWPYKPA